MFKSTNSAWVFFAVCVGGVVLLYGMVLLFPKEQPIKDIPTECFDIHDDGSVENIPCGSSF
jgi:hypothetical protein